MSFPHNLTISALPRNLRAAPGRLPASVAAVLGYAAWCALVLWMVGDALRNNDQAAYLNGGLQIAHGEVLPWHAILFNYDKEFGSYWLIAELLRISGFRSVVLVTNYAQAIAFCLSLGALVTYRLCRLPFSLVLPFALCPVLVLSVPFMGTGMISLTFLLFGFAIIRRGNPLRQGVACFLIALAAACRADVVLAAPALILCEISRRNLRGLVTSPIIWIISLCSILPPVIGLLLTPSASETLLSLVPAHVMIAFLIFGLGVTVLVLLVWSGLFFLAVGTHKQRWWLFYTLRALAPLIPLGFYAPQLTSPQQFFLPLACYVFTVSDRRALLAFSWLNKPRSFRQKLVLGAVLLLVILPWFVGLRAPNLAKIRPAINFPQDFPTAHGHYPMGAFAPYIFYQRNHGYVLDHNQKIFLAAERVQYKSCNGKVVLLRTPMYNYLELAARLKKLSVGIAKGESDSPCSRVYSDARSLLRGDVDTAGHLLRFASLAASYDGQAVLRIGTAVTDLGLALEALRDHFLGREFEFYVQRPNSKIILHRAVNGGAIYALSPGKCSIAPNSFEPVDARELHGQHFYLWTITRDHASPIVDVACPAGAQAGQITFTLPSWMGPK